VLPEKVLQVHLFGSNERREGLMKEEESDRERMNGGGIKKIVLLDQV